MSHTMMERTSGDKLYQALQIASDASAEEIRKAYLKAALKHHPDKGGDDEKFKEIANAFHVLSNPTLKKLYDETQEIIRQKSAREIIRKQRAQHEIIRKKRAQQESIRRKSAQQESTLESHESTPRMKVKKESAIKKNSGDGRFEKELFNVFQSHFGRESASTRSEGVSFGARKHHGGKRTVSDIEILISCGKSFFRHFEKNP